MFVLVTVTFALPRALPGDPLAALVEAGSPTAVQDDSLRTELAEYYGLDRPYLEQYGTYLSGLVRGDLGISIRHNRPVADLVLDRLPWTLLLISAGMLIAVSTGLMAGAHSGWRRGRLVDLVAEDLPLLPLFYPTLFAIHDRKVFDAWYFTPGGVAGVVPTTLNKHVLITGEKAGLPDKA